MGVKYSAQETIEEADDKGRLSGEGKEGKKRDKRNAVAEEGMKRLFMMKLLFLLARFSWYINLVANQPYFY